MRVESILCLKISSCVTEIHAGILRAYREKFLFRIGFEERDAIVCFFNSVCCDLFIFRDLKFFSVKKRKKKKSDSLFSQQSHRV